MTPGQLHHKHWGRDASWSPWKIHIEKLTELCCPETFQCCFVWSSNSIFLSSLYVFVCVMAVPFFEGFVILPLLSPSYFRTKNMQKKIENHNWSSTEILAWTDLPKKVLRFYVPELNRNKKLQPWNVSPHAERVIIDSLTPWSMHSDTMALLKYAKSATYPTSNTYQNSYILITCT